MPAARILGKGDVIVYRPEKLLKSTSRRFRWTKAAVSATVGLDETNRPARRRPAARKRRVCSEAGVGSSTWNWSGCEKNASGYRKKMSGCNGKRSVCAG